jgi:UDP-N-acetyl-D-glucosamine dehydrogenase
MQETAEGIDDRSAQVAIMGLGYVGLPLALHASEAGFRVVGFDVSPERVQGINDGRSPVTDISDEELSKTLRSGRLHATHDGAALAEVDIYVICVPTPLKHELPDMSYIESAATSVAEYLQAGNLVILESTTYPGTTEEFLKSILEAGGLRAGEDFYLGFSPERIDPGNKDYGLKNVPKIVGGIDDQSAVLMEAFYRSFVNDVVRVSSPAAAEMTKLLENTYRHINIALANEMAILCHDLGIDIWEVIDAAATKPFGFKAFYPGPGWGGHCIPVDPAYLSWRVRQMGATAHFVELAREINDRMPGYVVQRISECLNDQGKSLRASRVLVLGVAYKPDISDVRESPALSILERLQKAGSKVAFHDPYVDRVSLKEGNIERTQLTAAALRDADIVVAVTAHSSYDWKDIADRSRVILDTRNALKDTPSTNVVRL